MAHPCSDVPALTPQSPLFLSGGGEMGMLVRSLDWSTTALGLPDTWPEPVQTAVSICLNSRFPMVLWLGSEFTMLHNDSWRPVLGATKHPHGIGRPGREVWPEIWHIIGEQAPRFTSR